MYKIIGRSILIVIYQNIVVFLFVLDNSTTSLLQRIDKLGLRLRVAYIGDIMTSFILNQTQSGNPVIFFSQSPDILTSSQRFTRVRSVTSTLRNTSSRASNAKSSTHLLLTEPSN